MQTDLSSLVEKCVLRFYGHVKRMNDEGMAKKLYDLRIEGRQDRGRPARVWMDGVKDALNRRGWTLEQERVTVNDRGDWRGLLYRA